ncbi:MAG: hypothetical protein LAN71_03360 [Acidobacteriia bacterium]|nr:hypothetical protein [Terriglobia bacterium]
MTTLSKTALPPNVKPTQRPNPQWVEARSVFPIYLAIAKQVGAPIPVGADKKPLPEIPSAELFGQVRTWLDKIDQIVQPHQLRQLLQVTMLNASEGGLRAMILRYLRKTAKETLDRDKIDFLLVQYFVLCAPPQVYHDALGLETVAQVMRPVLGSVDPTPLEWCAPLETMIASMQACRSLRDMLKTSFILEGRRVKEKAGGMFYDPTALLSFIRFNFLVRRTLIELMHADLQAIRTALGALSDAHVKSLDCKPAGLSSAEPIQKILQITKEWKQPFQGEYNERTVSSAFDKLLALRSIAEQAVQSLRAGPPKSAPAATKPAAAQKQQTPSASPAPAAKPKAAAPPAQIDIEGSMEKLWEQLIASPPERGRSMTSVELGSARILLSSWEVVAFISADSATGEDLRRAVAARAIVAAAVDAAKKSGKKTGLPPVLAGARAEVTRLQGRVEVAKQSKDTEAAVNLGISIKRLASSIDEAEKA